jgi:hypothetical protein
LPKIIVGIEENDEEKQEIIIDKIEKFTKSIFGANGILSMKRGAVEIIPAFGSFGDEPWIDGAIHILLHIKEERTGEILDEIENKFYHFVEETLRYQHCLVLVNSLPEHLFRKF